MTDQNGMNEPSEPPKRKPLTMKIKAQGADANTAESAGEPNGGDGGVKTSPPTVETANETGSAFLVAIIIGAVCSLVGLGDGLPFRLVGVLGPILAVAGFGLYGRHKGWAAWPDTRQRFADACYFLGFILTMWALIIGFLPAGIWESQQIDSRAVLRHFGMALGATAVGLIARILVLQTRSANRASIEADLDRAARRIAAESLAIGTVIADARRQFEEERSESLRLQREQIKAIMEAVSVELATALAPLKKDLPQIADNGSKALTAAIDRLAVRLESQGQSIENASTLMTTSFSSVTDSAHRITRLTDVGGEGIASLLRLLAQAAAGTRTEVEKAGVGAVTLKENSDAASATMISLTNVLSHLQTSVQRDVAAIAAVPGQVQSVGAATSDAVVAFERRVTASLNDSQTRVDSDLTKAADAMTASIDRFIAELQTIAAAGAAETAKNER